MLETLHFLRPWWLLGLLPVVLLAIAWARRRIAGSHWETSVAPELLAVLLEPGDRRGTHHLVWVVACTLALVTVGLAGPAWERLPQPVEQKSDAMVIVFDLSLSMLAGDVPPSRLVRARQKITDVLRDRKEGFTALIAYAGDAHAVAPLTDDTRTIENLLGALSPEMMPVLGSDADGALTLARELFANAGLKQGRILLVTDGVDSISDAAQHRDNAFPVAVLGVGTAAGSTIPLDFVNQPGQVLRTQQGEAIRARLDEAKLAEIAELCYGRYRTLSLSDEDITYLTATPLPQDDDTLKVEREFDSWADRGYWVVVIVLPLLLLGFRRGVFAMVAIMVLPAPAHAGWWDNLWERHDQQAQTALREGQPDVAAVLFDDPEWRSVAQYRSGDYKAAADGFAMSRDPDGHYNRGNALARGGQLQPALDAYDQALAQAPDHEDALFNRALVEKLLQQQQSEEQSEGQQPQDGDSDNRNPSQDSDSSEQPPEQPEDGDPSDQNPENQDSEAEKSEPQQGEQQADSEVEETNRDEKQDALEQWLRRVPDDPGGLLRRKFQYETNQRLRRGDYGDRDTEKIW